MFYIWDTQWGNAFINFISDNKQNIFKPKVGCKKSFVKKKIVVFIFF